MADPYTQAFAQLQTALVDLDGDGVPDVAVPASSAQDPMREINRRFPERSPATRAGRQPVEVRSAEAPENALLAAATFPAKAFVGQVDSAAQSLADVAIDPTLANVTNAGVQNALLFGRPVAAGVMGGMGLLEAARRDLMGGGSASAQAFLTPEQREELKAAKAKIAKGQFSSGAERRSLEATVNRLGELDAKLAGEKASNEERLRSERAAIKQQEDAAARSRAQGAYDAGLKTDRRFSDTTVGQVFDKLGPVAPGVVGLGTGAMTGAGMRYMGVTGKGALYGVPAGLGAVGGAFSANWPMIYDANYAPTVNPSFQAAQNYVREAPADDPRAAQLKGLMADGTISQSNPVRAKGEEELYNPVKIAERSGFGAAEGILGGIMGSEIGPAFRYMTRGAPQAAYEIGQVPGRALRGMVDGVVTPPVPRNALLTAADDPAAQAFQELRVGAVQSRQQQSALPPPSSTNTGLPPGPGAGPAAPPPAAPPTTPAPAATGAADGLTEAERADAIVRALMNRQRPPQGQPPALPPPPGANAPNPMQTSMPSARAQFQTEIASALTASLRSDPEFVRKLASRPEYYAQLVPRMLRNGRSSPADEADALAMIQEIVARSAPRNALLP